ncbi:Serine/threonine-protein kinase KIN4 [Fusarium odoratissimum]|uniref:non-specific serine/threonine protein kinase n=1 Tax=Fusarium oxysporum f. sp. cubense (strain race 4) TaxID=2502994 RepID=N1RGS3_FUSC4|nr:Serine/threonine-protein kinase KIN4 [Fusarium odoratissimum]
MSSAALQTAPHQHTALASSPLSTPSSRQYRPSHSSPNGNGQAYNAQQTSTASSSSRRPPSRKTNDSAPSPSYHLAPGLGSPVTASAPNDQEPSASASDWQGNMPPVAPPRTSSNHQSGSSRRSQYSNEKSTNSPRRNESTRTGSRGDSAAAENGHRSSKADAAARASSRDGRAATTSMPVRSAHSTPSKPVHDATDSLTKAIAAAQDTIDRDRNHAAAQHSVEDAAAPPPVVATGDHHEERRGQRSRHDHSRSHKGNTKFGDFILGNTIGEGEFGKVKLGWKQDSSVQVAIKLIKRDSVGSNPSRFAKIYREVAILRGVQHPNIVRLIDKVETDRHIGIILEYASGGELFDYILNHRYLKDNAARRLFAQLVSGVGYLHKKGIVHRDLKLENLLLDRNRNIIITDFGFANTFDPNEELSKEEELNLTDKEFVKRMGLDRVKMNGSRKGDLMQTSCGSPCYAAPELVAYNAQQTSTASSSSRRPPSRKTNDSAPSPSYHLAPGLGSPVTASAPNDQEPSASASDWQGNMPPVAPPRTSSNHQSGSSRRSQYSNEKSTNSPRRNESTRTGSRGDSAAAENGHRSSKADAAARASSRDGRAATTSMPVRSAHSTPSKPVHDATDSLTKAIAAAQDTIDRDRNHAAAQHSVEDAAAPPPVVATGDHHEERRGQRSRHDHSRSHKGNTKFGDFILGNTIGEGEFGKVKLGWKQDSSVQVAIKLIKRDSVGSNPSRFAKIYREVAILRGVQHPNIVRLIDKVETDRHIGIILEYASGGELFDYILNHRYLKDNAARRLFAQLVSGVGYLHKKGIVHRDLKLENLLLDRNRNIIITDFGFANTFDPNEELSKEEELNLTDKEFVKRMGLDRVKMNGSRKGDLMQTSCGSPCYAAPELVVSDSLYTGRKVDVWSCGVILYAMLAGYLPFDDDPANPEGDNINLLYKYIVTTPLTFPEYVTPHARDLLRRILVPNPRKRADLFEVARHSWLSEYANLVEFITSSTTLPSEVPDSGVSPDDYAEAPTIARSSSVREASKQKQSHPPVVGGLAKTHGSVDPESETTHRSTPKDAKRRTVQVEYVAPTTKTQRGADAAPSKPSSHSLQQQVPVDVPEANTEKPLPREPPMTKDNPSRTQSRRPQSSHKSAVPQRPARDTRATSDNAFMTGPTNTARPRTQGSMQSSASMGLQSHGNYGQPAPPTIADTNAHGRIQQPQNPEDEENIAKTVGSVPPKVMKMSTFQNETKSTGRGHKRSNTLGDLGNKIMGRSGSIFGGRSKKRAEQQQQPDKSRKYPPVSMPTTMMPGEEAGPRPSMESKASRRSFSLGLGKKRSGSVQGSSDKKDRRFSLVKAMGLGKDQGSVTGSEADSQQDLPIQHPRAEQLRGYSAHEEARHSEPYFDAPYEQYPQRDTAQSSPVYHTRHANAQQQDGRRPSAIPTYIQGSHLNTGSDSSVDVRRPPTDSRSRPYQADFSESEGYDGRPVGSSRDDRSSVLQKSHKKFADAYDGENYRGHEGSSGAAKRVMDFFRRRGKARGGEDR